ncbi:MAG: hypothetical protein K8R21_13900 [Leptospira sp.]|nr:hypothetical protein [Leptospira sp.]
MTKIFSFAILLLLTACIVPKSSKLFPLLPSGVKPYTAEAIGITPPAAAAEQAALPMISDAESQAMKDFLTEMQDLDLMSDQAWQKLSVEAWKTIQFSPLTDNELDSKIFREMRGETIPDKIAGSNAELLAKESKSADDFFGRIKNDFPVLSNQDLINIRKKLTVSLVAIRLQMDFGDDANGIPDDFLQMIREKTVALRMKISEELLKRGVTSI